MSIVLKVLSKKLLLTPPQLLNSPDTPNVLQAMMQLQQAKSRAEAANKLVLEEEKERDTAEKAVEELKRQLQPKRARTDDDAGDAHEVLAEVENWDLRDHRQQATRVRNRRNVQVGLKSIEVSHRHGRLLASHVSWSGWVDFILVFWGLCSGSRYHRVFDVDTRSHGSRK
jgi:hypothetical protein